MEQAVAAPTLSTFLLARIAEDEAHIKREWDHGWPDMLKMLAECKAKRRILERAEAARSQVVRARELRWDHVATKAALASYEDSMRDLAAVYAAHPDYRDEWRP